MASNNNVDVRNNSTASRFEAQVDGALAVVEYRRDEHTIIFTHTEVPKALAGRGIASALARAALTYAREHKLSVVPLCPFIAGYIRQHAEYVPLVHPEFRNRVVPSERGE